MLQRQDLVQAIDRAANWLSDIAQIKVEGIPYECPRAAHMPQFSWQGAIKGEYDAAKKQWDMFCPVWHSGQAAGALLRAYQLTHDEKYLNSAYAAADFVVAQQIKDKNSEDYGLIYAIEDYYDGVNTSAILESLNGLIELYRYSGNEIYYNAVVAAVAWVWKKAYVGEGHFWDNYNIYSHEFMVPEWENTCKPPIGYEKHIGRPLMDNAIFLKVGKLTGNKQYLDLFYEGIDYLLTHEVPSGTWNNYAPSKGQLGISHPRQSFWWGYPMAEAYAETHDERYYECLKRCGTWYLKAQRMDGGMFRNTDLEFNTPSFGQCTSGIACAALVWMALYQIDKEPKWVEACDKALEFNMNMQFIQPQDANLNGAILERTVEPNHTDASPYRLRDLASIFFIIAADTYIKVFSSNV